MIEQMPEQQTVRKASEEYYLSELEKYRPGDKFPNVGYVRRMKALLQQR